MLVPTSPDKLCDARGRPYFVWEEDVTLDELRALLADGDESTRLYWHGVVLRQAKPDDAIVLLGRDAIAAAVPRLAGGLGRTEAFWRWLADRWATHG